MWNCDWEYENQETLKQWYEEKLTGIRPYSAVRKIICKRRGISTLRYAESFVRTSVQCTDALQKTIV